MLHLHHRYFWLVDDKFHHLFCRVIEKLANLVLKLNQYFLEYKLCIFRDILYIINDILKMVVKTCENVRPPPTWETVELFSSPDRCQASSYLGDS